MDPATQPFLPPDATWVGVMLLVIAGLFLAAVVVGKASRMLSPEAYDDTGPQDEPPAASVPSPGMPGEGTGVLPCRPSRRPLHSPAPLT